MTSAPVEREAWAWRRWGSLTTLIFIVQLALIFWLSDRSASRPRPPRPGPILHLAGGATAELLALRDPTLFALPHRQGFSGRAWMEVHPVALGAFNWSAPTNWLAPPDQELGAVFNRFLQTNTLGSLYTAAMPLPEPVLPELPVPALGPEKSAVRIEGEVASRRLLTPLVLSAWPHSEMLGRTEVQVLVNAQGRPVSSALLSSSGSKPADDQALEQARKARFEPLDGSGSDRLRTGSPLARLAWGRLIFEWQTLPLTNSPAN